MRGRGRLPLPLPPSLPENPVKGSGEGSERAAAAEEETLIARPYFPSLCSPPRYGGGSAPAASFGGVMLLYLPLKRLAAELRI